MSIKLNKTTKTIGILLGLTLFAIIGLAQTKKIVQPTKAVILSELTATVYRSPTCNCCEKYISYLRARDIKVEEKLESDMSAIKTKLGVPADLFSCHTMKIGDYVVEGHVPIEAIEKLTSEKPAIVGIGLPGMPSGSPGMPGAKTGPFEIKQFKNDGSVSLFIAL